MSRTPRLTGRAPGPSWHRQLVESAQAAALVSAPGIRVSQAPGGTTVRLPRAITFGRPRAPVALAQYAEGLVVTLRAGILLLRGLLVAVAEQTATLQAGDNYLWLQFSIDPAITPTPALHRGASWPALALATQGYWPLSRWTVSAGVAALAVLYHPGGNIPYPVD
jgi:hypothetical protein